MISLLQETILLIGITIGGAVDAKTGYIYDWITIPMILLGLVFSIYQQQMNNLLLAAIIFCSLFILYKTGKLGGGDVKLFTAIALLNPTNNIAFLFTGIIIACMGAMIFYSTYYTAKYIRLNKGINLNENTKGIQKAVIFGAILALYFLMLTQLGLISLISLIPIIIASFFGLIFIAFQEGIKKHFFEKKIKLSKIEEDEVLAEGQNTLKVNLLLKGKNIIGAKEKKLLLANKIKEIVVLRALPPFGPFIAIGFIAAAINPNLILMLFI